MLHSHGRALSVHGRQNARAQCTRKECPFFPPTTALHNNDNIIGLLYNSGSQSVVRGPPGVLERVPGGTQLNDSLEPNGPLWVCNSENVQMEPNGPVRVRLVPFVHSQSYRPLVVHLVPNSHLAGYPLEHSQVPLGVPGPHFGNQGFMVSSYS